MKFDKPIALAADHGGYELKEAIKAHLDELGVAYTDFGTDSTASVDYPDFAAKGCKAVQDGSCAQQRQRPLPGRARRGRGSGLPDRGRLPERRVRGRTPPDAHRQDDGAGKPLSFTLPARQAEYL